MSEKYFAFYDNYYEAAKYLKGRKREQFITAVVDYFFTGKEPVLPDDVMAVFIGVRIGLDTSIMRSKSAMQRWNKDDANSMQSRCKADANAMQTPCKSDANGIQVLSIKEEVQKEVSKDTSKKMFKKPTADEIELFCSEHDLDVNPESFIDHYESNGWRVGGKSAMKNWQAACRNWHRRNHPKLKGGNDDISDIRF
jgi:hypothetical protein